MFWNGQWYIFTPDKTYAMNLKTGVFSLPKEQILDAQEKSFLKSHKFLFDKQGNVFIFGKNGLCRKFSLITDRSILNARGRNFTAAEAVDGKVFIASYGNGLYVYGTAADSMQHFSATDKEPLFHSYFLLNIFIDRSQAVWICTGSCGIYRLREQAELNYEMVKM